MEFDRRICPFEGCAKMSCPKEEDGVCPDYVRLEITEIVNEARGAIPNIWDEGPIIRGGRAGEWRHAKQVSHARLPGQRTSQPPIRLNKGRPKIVERNTLTERPTAEISRHSSPRWNR